MRMRTCAGALRRCGTAFLLLPALALGAAQAPQQSAEVKETLALFISRDSTLASALEQVPGYAVFPSVIKGGVGFGAARGSGQLIEGGKAVGTTTLTQVTVGFQLGGQVYSELVIFENETTLQAFKKGNFEFAAQLSAVAAAEGASANAKFEHGVKVVTFARGGLMYEASVGGQKFGFDPY
jgi:lipid-binding SYLF domain-containing protein